MYKNLIEQLEKLRKHNRQGSIKTKERYYQAMQRFCRYLAETWRLQKLANIAPKHIEGYAEFLKKNNKSASTIKTDLSAIRFFHDKMSETRHRLPR
jgi:site-specific recombinase XerD